MQRIGVVLAAILLLPVIAAGTALLMGWPEQDALTYFSIAWVIGWTSCYLGARAIAWLITRLIGNDESSK
jgi:hypothetical protein